MSPPDVWSGGNHGTSGTGDAGRDFDFDKGILTKKNIKKAKNPNNEAIKQIKISKQNERRKE